MPMQHRLAALLPRFYLGSALSFAVLAAAFVSVVFWSNFARYDKTPLALAIVALGLASGFFGLVTALLGYRTTRGQTFNRSEWRAGSLVFVGALLVGIAAVVAIKLAFPEVPE
jgi:F0F1-type ATP synthase membrane subunit c/vacuolar-type H+-ATPase subunit K